MPTTRRQLLSRYSSVGPQSCRRFAPPPPVPHISFSSITFTTSQDFESDSSASTDLSVELTDTDRCHALLAPLYGFPPRPRLLHRQPEQKVDPSKEFQSGVMMAAQRIKTNITAVLMAGVQKSTPPPSSGITPFSLASPEVS